MTPEEFARGMDQITYYVNDEGWFDEEMAHVKADDLMMKVLTSLGYGEGVRIFDDMPKYYS